jgi:hypothetical protein
MDPENVDQRLEDALLEAVPDGVVVHVRYIDTGDMA